jgi:hypothetical protein
MISPLSPHQYDVIPSVELIIPANGEPLGIQDYLNAANIKLKKHVDNLSQKIVMARQTIEEYTGRALLTCTVDQIIDYDSEVLMDKLVLRKPPVRKVVGVYTRDPFRNETLVPSTSYYVSTSADPFTTLGLLPGQIWNFFLRDDEAFRVRTISGYATLVASVNTGTGVINCPGHPYNNGDLVRLQGAYLDDGTAPVMPAGLALYTNYYAVNVSGDNLQLSATVNGSPIIPSSVGAGKLFLGEIPEKLRRAVMITATYDFLNDEYNDTGAEGTTGLPQEIRDLVRSYKRLWV